MKQFSKELLSKELLNKADTLDAATLNRAGDYHMLDLHVGKSDEWLENRSEKIQGDASSFFDGESLAKYLAEGMRDKYSANQIAGWVLSDFNGRQSLDVFVENDEIVGRGYSYERGEFYNSYIARYILEFKGYREYRNPITGLPFDVVSGFPVDPEADE